MTEEEVAMVVDEPCDDCPVGSSFTPVISNSTTPVQVVKPTVRVDNSPGCTLTSSGYNFSSVALSTKTSQHNSSNTNNANTSNSEQVGDANNNAEDRLQAEALEAEEVEFVWHEYLELTGSTPAPDLLFPHVETSLRTFFEDGMKIEVPNRFVNDSYWVASIIMTAGPLLRLRYLGFDAEQREDFWYETSSGVIRPIGWCTANNKKLEPPPKVALEWGENWMEKLNECLANATTIPSFLLEASEFTVVDQIKEGMKFEVQDDMNLINVWIATVIRNVSGRLLLRYDGVDSASYDFWLFYLSFRIHPFGWARGNECTFKPPIVLRPLKSVQEWANILNESMSTFCKMTIPSVIFINQEVVKPHKFQEGMKLEVLDPQSRTRICAATVSKVYNRYYFNVQLDHSSGSSTCSSPFICCHSQTPCIFPPGWAKANHLEVEFWDRGNSNDEFEWDEYVENIFKQTGSPVQLAPPETFECVFVQQEEKFEMGMKLEAVNLSNPHQICVATVCKVTGHLLWIQLDTSSSIFPNQIVACTSHDIFPCNWCDYNGYTLKVPTAWQQSAQKSSNKKVAIVIPKKQQTKNESKSDDESLKDSDAPGRAWCPVIYINHKCFTGPFLSISRIAELPKHVGPGPIHLVLKEVISMIVGVSYLPSRCLSVLQSERYQNGIQQLIKAKYKGKKYRAMVDIVNNSDKVKDYCRSVCKTLQCCANLFGPDCYYDNCPENCYSLTKSNPNTTIKRKKRRRKAKTVVLVVKNGETAKPPADDSGKVVEKFPGDEAVVGGDELNNCDDEEKAGNDDDSCEPPKEKRKYVHRIIPKSDIVTRGAKLPDFSVGLGKRKHKNSISKPTVPTAVEKLNKNVEQTNSVNNDNDTQPKKEIINVLNSNFKTGFGVDDNASNVSLEAEANTSSEEDHLQLPLLQLESNPLQWTIEQVSDFIKNTDCAAMVRLLKEQEIDGQALLLLTLPTIQEHLELKLGPAIKLCHHIEQLKSAFYNSQYGSASL
ncbi:Scm-like with four MBT domains protein 2 [Chamberlinius hualienensis]